MLRCFQCRLYAGAKYTKVKCIVGLYTLNCHPISYITILLVTAFDKSQFWTHMIDIQIHLTWLHHYVIAISIN